MAYASFENWSLPKQYLAAHFYLSEEKPATITESQKALLGALHLLVSHGRYIKEIEPVELNKCTEAEKRKRIESWNKLGNMSKKTAMKMFIDTVNKLFPWWVRYKGLYTKYEIEWKKIKGNEERKNIVGRLPKISSKNRSEKPIEWEMKRDRKEKYVSLSPKCVEEVKKFEKGKYSSIKPLRLNASSDISDTLYKLKKFAMDPLNLEKTEKSVHYKNCSYLLKEHEFRRDDTFVLPKHPISRYGKKIETVRNEDKKFPVENLVRERIRRMNETIELFEQEFEI